MGCIHSNEQNGIPKQPVDGELTNITSTVPNIPPPPVPHEHTNKVSVRALFDYIARDVDDLSFHKGDKMVLLEDPETNEWWFAQHLTTGQRGYIPHNYVSKEDGKPESHDAWYNIVRREADKSLLLPGNPDGTYIIRPSADDGFYALSVRSYHEAKHIWIVRHFKIRPLDGGQGYFISPKKTFGTITELTNFYSANKIGSAQLAGPCPRTYSPPVHFRDLIQSAEAFTKTVKLGAGSFGEVYSGKWNRTVDVAIKTLKKGAMSTEAFLEEAKIMHKLNHANILPVLAVCTEPEIFIVTEMMAHGALLDILREEKEGMKITLEAAVDIAAQISAGMEYLEMKELVHRDLRAANILVGDSLLVKVADFGLAKLTDDRGAQKADAATKFPIRWTAPEAAVNKKFSVKSDVWSFGILLYEIITHGRIPYAGMSNQQILVDTLNGYRLPKPEKTPIECPEKLYETMQRCWKKQPEDRPTFASLRDYFDDYFVANEGQYDMNISAAIGNRNKSKGRY
ncbi:tyrosine-protein kinase yes-like isoform X2 [Tubulanus polymorphus]